LNAYHPQQTQHPFIQPVDSVDYILEKQTAIFVRTFAREGSLRDRLHKVHLGELQLHFRNKLLILFYFFL